MKLLQTPSSRAWFCVAVLTAAGISSAVDRQIVSLLVEPIRAELEVSDTQVSLAMGFAVAAFISIAGVPLGWLADRTNRPRLIVIGIALWSAMTALTAFVTTFKGFFATRVGVGIGEAVLGPAAIALISEQFDRPARPKALGIFSLGVFFGSGLSYFVGAKALRFVEVSGGDWRQVFSIVGIAGAFTVPFVLLIREPRLSRWGGLPQPALQRTGASALRDLWQGLVSQRRTFVPLCLGFGCSAAVNYGIAGWLATFFQRTHGWSTPDAGVLQGSLTMSVGVLAVVGGGFAASALERRGMVDAPLRIAIIGALGMMVFGGLYPLVADSRAAALLLIGVNIFAALPWGAASAAVANLFAPGIRSQAIAVYFLVVGLIGGAFGPTAVALVTDRLFGDPSKLRYALSLVTLTGMTVAVSCFALARRSYPAAINRVQQ